jgi:uncharacterized membrane protein YccF (DUF307 family)
MSGYTFKILGNITWLIFGGIVVAVEYFVFSLLLMVTVVGIPFSFQTLKLSSFALWPFGRTSVVKAQASGCLYTGMNIFWIIFGGIWIAITHFIFGIILGITIIGIPFGVQHFKLASIAITPFGRVIVPSQ